MTITSSLEPMGKKPTIVNLTALGTSLVKIADQSSFSGVRRVRIYNLHPTNSVAYNLEVVGVTPSFTATTSTLSTTDGILVAPSSDSYINLVASMSLWVVASGASTPCQVVIFDEP